MGPIRGIDGPSGPNPLEGVGTAKGPMGTPAPSSAPQPVNEEEAQLLQALQAFFSGQGTPVDLAALAQALLQEGVIRG
jgi:hypothetical protein